MVKLLEVAADLPLDYCKSHRKQRIRKISGGEKCPGNAHADNGQGIITNTL